LIQIAIALIYPELSSPFTISVVRTLAEIASLYRRFAEAEAHSRSPLYEQLALEIAGDESTLEFLSTFPRPKEQPNLLFAAVQYVCGTPTDWKHFRTSLLVSQKNIREVMMKRRTQTNEPARCATLLPLLALLPQPLALLEIGASAGLCLLPDLYGYEYNQTVHISPTSGTGVVPPIYVRDKREDPAPRPKHRRGMATRS